MAQSLTARPPCGGSDFQRSGGVMTLTGCRIRFDCPVGPAGVVIEIPCSGGSFPQFLFVSTDSIAAFNPRCSKAGELAAVVLGREARLEPSVVFSTQGTLNTAARLRPAGTG